MCKERPKILPDIQQINVWIDSMDKPQWDGWFAIHSNAESVASAIRGENPNELEPR